MIEIIFERKNNRAIATDNGKLIGVCDFSENGDEWNIIHTEVNKEYQGQGIAKKLVECIARQTNKTHKRLVADCSYAQKILGSEYK